VWWAGWPVVSERGPRQAAEESLRTKSAVKVVDNGADVDTPAATPWRTTRGRPRFGWLVLAVFPLLVVAMIRLRPSLDVAWENHPAHFWLVLAASAVSVMLGATVTGAARQRRDARLLLISLAFIASAGFLGLHALATPGVLVGPNGGFELATPVGLVAAGAFVAASALPLERKASRTLLRRSGWLLGGLFGLMGGWAIVSLAELPPLRGPLLHEELGGWQVVLAVLGVGLYGGAAAGYYRLYRRRRARFVLAVTFAFALLAEAMVVIALAENWRISWWEWHTLMLAAFAVIVLASRREWHEERFSALYLEETLAGTTEASIMFADLQGFTSFSERHDPETVAAMLNAYFGRLVPMMERFGGEVHQIVGDAVMVVFNKDGDQPDHAAMASRAGLAFQREAAEVARGHEDWPRFRVGVNTGEVLTGVIGGERGLRRHDLVGDTVNLAARLESQAPVGGVLIGLGTFDRLPDGAEVERLPAVVVKGKQEPVQAFVLQALP
jgi:adenylate cyclase